MNDLNAAQEQFLAAQVRFESNGSATTPGWIRAARTSAAQRFRRKGFPTTRVEEWKYTNLNPLAEGRFEVASGTERSSTNLDLANFALAGTGAVRLVFVNGLFDAACSSVGGLPSDVRVVPLSAATATDLSLVEANLADHAGAAWESFDALNTAFLSEGALVQIPAGTIVAEPIHLFFLTQPGDAQSMSHPRTLILLGDGAQATVVETYSGADGSSRSFTNSRTTIRIAPHASLQHFRLERESANAIHIGSTDVRIESAGTFSSLSLGLGGALVRKDVDVVLAGERADVTLNGLDLAAGTRHFDNNTCVEHASPNATSSELYKSVLDGSARGVFSGKIRVQPDAQKTDAKQNSKSLLLSDTALMNTKPQLEILADDVRCTHGSTVGQLDPNAMFYMRTRGIGVREASSLLTYAFASEMVAKVANDAIRLPLEETLVGHLRPYSRIEVTP